ncbi:MAG: hypothetical protein ACT6Q9_18705, partial [Polaromonas sp.]|uniref:hypothetical protein n=1 Tax=Polaromonas sp. TaxID=1869339 RepID=UPI0040352B78
MAQVMGEQLKQMSSGTAERQVAACAEMSRWLAHRASASETAMAHEEMNSEVERFFPGRPDACHALARSVENAAREFLASLQTVRPREPDLTKTLRSLDDTTQAAPRCEGLRQRAVRRQIDFPDGFNEMSALATAISQASVLNFITEEENRAKELATAYLARIRAK